jgi:hypothetical protein
MLGSRVGERDTSYLMADPNGWMFKRLPPDELK